MLILTYHLTSLFDALTLDTRLKKTVGFSVLFYLGTNLEVQVLSRMSCASKAPDDGVRDL
jgi:hypothetical protein